MKTKVVKNCAGGNNGCYFETIIIDYVTPVQWKTKIVFKVCLN